MPRLTILSIAYALAPVGPDAVGGAEQILATLDAALTHAGHRSIVIACRGSRVAGKLVCTDVAAGDASDEAARERAESAARQAAEQVLSQQSVDIIHMHGLDFQQTIPKSLSPKLVTLHLPPAWYGCIAKRPNLHLHAVSTTHHHACVASRELAAHALLPPIENGVAVDRLATGRHAKRNFALMLGRVCREKGQHTALQAAHDASIPLVLAGEVFAYPDHRAYFETQVLPLLDRTRVFVGAVRFERKRRLLSAARCVLVPSTADETSSLVAMEALACGTPVIAFPAGALPEIVEHNRTGFIVENSAEMAQAIRRADQIDPEACREVAHARFQSSRMTDAYLERYRQLCTGDHRCAAA